MGIDKKRRYAEVSEY